MDPHGSGKTRSEKNVYDYPETDAIKHEVFMRVSDQFILRTIADENLLIPVGEAAIHVKGLIALSESGALLYNKLKDGATREELVAALTEEYEVTPEEAAEDTEAFLDQLRKLKMLVEE